MYQRKVDVDMLNAVKSVLADVSSVSPSSEQSYVSLRYNGKQWNTSPRAKQSSDEGLTLDTSANTLTGHADLWATTITTSLRPWQEFTFYSATFL